MLADAELDVLVVGGGITGACIALEAARRGLRAGLVDRDDFGGGATANCLKIVHGGLRYLQHLDVRRARESAQARSLWLRSAPHLVEPLPVLLPTYRGQFPPRAALAAALALNEALSLDRNRGLGPEHVIPRARLLGRQECLALEPAVDAPGLTGGVYFHDALMYSPERVTLEVVAAAAAAGAVVANYVEFVEPATRDGRVTGARLRDTLTGELAELRTRWVINATGSAAPAVAGRLLRQPAVVAQAYSVALNFVTRKPAGRVAYTVMGGAADPDRVGGRGARRLFVVPWRGQLMIGTAHLPYRGDPASFVLSPEDVERFAREIATATPAFPLDGGDVALVHAGLLPVAGASHSAGVRLLKHHGISDHAAEGCAGALSVVSVKFTTAPQLARDVVDRIGAPAAAGRPNTLPLPGGGFPSLAVLRADAARRFSALLPAEVLEHLVRSYGARYEAVVGLREELAGWDERVVPEAPVIRAQLAHGARHEHARTADDLLWRRTELGPRGLITERARTLAEAALADAARPGETAPLEG
jgi:glycerol-3-phosphate dehydrogenase